MLGPYSSGLTKAIAPVTEQYGVPMVEANGASLQLFNKGYRYLFAVLSTTEQYLASAVALAAELAEREGRDPATLKLAAVFENDPFSQDIRAGVLADAASFSIQVVVDDQLPPELNDMAATLAKAKAVKPDILVPETDEELAARGFSFRLRRDRLRQVRRREGRYLLRSNMTAEDPATLWRLYMQLIEIEQAFKELKHDLAIRPVFHQREDRIEAHIFVSFIAYCLLVTLKNLARPHACGLTPRAILESFATIQMVDVHLPTADGRHLILPRHTRPNKEHELLLHQLGMTLPTQPAPRISA